MSTQTAYCQCCQDNKPFSLRHNGGESWDMCCDDCHYIIATFNTGHPFPVTPPGTAMKTLACVAAVAVVLAACAVVVAFYRLTKM